MKKYINPYETRRFEVTIHSGLFLKDSLTPKYAYHGVNSHQACERFINYLKANKAIIAFDSSVILKIRDYKNKYKLYKVTFTERLNYNVKLMMQIVK